MCVYVYISMFLHVYRWMDRWIDGYVHTSQRLHIHVNTIQRSWTPGFVSFMLCTHTRPHTRMHTHTHKSTRVHMNPYVCVKERERESARARTLVEERARDTERGWGEVGGAGRRERSSICSSVCEREFVCVYVCEWVEKRESEYVWERERKCVCEGVNVCVCECVCICVCVCV